MPDDISAGLLMYQQDAAGVSVLLAHPGGPFFRNKDDGAWTIPKGLVEPGEELMAAACREFVEETGLPAPSPSNDLVGLGELKQRSGKRVHAWAFSGTLPEGFVVQSGHFTMVWPPRSGKEQSFPEIDRVQMFPLDEAAIKILAGQREFLDRLQAALARQPA